MCTGQHGARVFGRGSVAERHTQFWVGCGQRTPLKNTLKSSGRALPSPRWGRGGGAWRGCGRWEGWDRWRYPLSESWVSTQPPVCASETRPFGLLPYPHAYIPSLGVSGRAVGMCGAGLELLIKVRERAPACAKVQQPRSALATDTEPSLGVGPARISHQTNAQQLLPQASLPAICLLPSPGRVSQPPAPLRSRAQVRCPQERAGYSLRPPPIVHSPPWGAGKSAACKPGCGAGRRPPGGP